MNGLFDRIYLVDERMVPTDEEINICLKNKWCDFDVSNRSKHDWYCLLRKLQGHPELYMNTEETVPMIDNHNFLTDSAFCEYAYVINLDENVLEYWKGFQKIPQKNNRYGKGCEDGFYPCKLAKVFPLAINNIDRVVKEMKVIR